MNVRAALVALACSGCGGAIANGSHDATQAAVNVIDDPAYRAKLDDVARSMGSAGAAAARDELLSQATAERLNALERSFRYELDVAVLDLGERSRVELVAVRSELLAGLQDEVRRIVRAAIDEALSETTLTQVDALRERAVGAPLRKDVDQLIDDATARANSSITLSATRVEQETLALAEKWKWLALGLAVLVAALMILHAHAIHALRVIGKRV